MTDAGRLLSEDEIRGLLVRDEGQFLEFKSVWDQEGERPRGLRRPQVRDTIAEYVAAFANADGGPLLLGVEDDGRATRHGYPEEAVLDSLAVPGRRLRPPVRCHTGRIRIDGVEVLAFDVPNAPEAVMVEVNGFRYRVGDQVVREPQEVISRRKGQAELKNADYRDMFRLSRYAAVRELRRLVDEGFLRIEGERRGTRYLPHAALGVARE